MKSCQFGVRVKLEPGGREAQGRGGAKPALIGSRTLLKSEGKKSRKAGRGRGYDMRGDRLKGTFTPEKLGGFRGVACWKGFESCGIDCLTQEEGARGKGLPKQYRNHSKH